MRSLNRHGATLAELVVTLALVGVLLVIVTQLLGAGARLVTTATSAVVRNRDISTTLALIERSVRSTSPADLIISSSDTLGFDRRVGEAAACRLSAGGIVVFDSAMSLARPPAPGRDELLILTTIDPARWVRQPLTTIASTACAPGRSGIELGVAVIPSQAQWVRIVTPVRLRRYRSGRNYWFGLEDRIGTGRLQPFAGPIGGKISFGLGSGSLVVALASPRTVTFTVPLGAAGR